MLSNLIILSDLLHHLVHHFHIKLHHFMIQYTTLPFFKILQNTSKYKGLRSYINLWKSIIRKSINSCLYASISSKTSVFMGFSCPYFLFLSPTTPFLHHFTLNYTFSRTFPFPRTACPLLRGNTSPLSFVMCHVPKVSVMFWGSCHIRLLL